MRGYLGLGSNLGNRRSNLRKAIELINSLNFTRVSLVSPLYINPAQGQCGDDFFNIVIEVNTLLSPYELLVRLKAIERKLGREDKYLQRPRTIDIDILWFEGIKIKAMDLVVPHPKMFERDFVVVPLAEISDLAEGAIEKVKKTGVLCRL